MREGLDPLPRHMIGLPEDERGYPIPWFVPFIENAEGVKIPEFRVMDTKKWVIAIRERCCWVCGLRLGRHLTFPIGPMCAINNITSEPPAHYDCALWSVRNCPFLSRPKMIRREGALPPAVDPTKTIGGIALLRNPEVTVLWTTQEYRAQADGRGGHLLHFGEAEHVEWWRERNKATQQECFDAIQNGLAAALASLPEIPNDAECAEFHRRALGKLMPWLPVL